jgi:hypothetical protein
MVTTMSQIM